MQQPLDKDGWESITKNAGFPPHRRPSSQAEATPSALRVHDFELRYAFAQTMQG